MPIKQKELQRTPKICRDIPQASCRKQDRILLKGAGLIICEEGGLESTIGGSWVALGGVWEALVNSQKNRQRSLASKEGSGTKSTGARMYQGGTKDASRMHQGCTRDALGGFES